MSDVPSARGPGKVEPYIPASQSLPELTVGVIILGSLLAVILAAANAYLGMVAGMTVSASVPAAVISMAVFRLLRTGNILQNNAVQTAAASGASIASGVIFTLPALILIGHWNGFPYWQTVLISGFGGVLGVLFTIPLRRALIIDQPLQFPEGVATAEVLKVGAEGGGGVGLLVLAGLIGAIGKIGSTGLKFWAEIVEVGAWITGGTAAKVAGTGAVANGGVPFYFGINASPALLSVGYIVGFNVAAVIFSGAVLNRWVAVPLFAEFGDPTAILTEKYAALATGVQVQLNLGEVLVGADPVGTVSLYHKYVTRYLGVGGMLIGGLWSLFKLRASLIGGVTAGLEAYKRGKAGGEVPRTERDMPMNIILILIAASVIPLFFLFWHFTNSPGIGAVMAVVMVIAGFLFAAVSSYMAGLVGSSNNPVSGITISTILVSALLLLALGVDSQAGPVAAILIGGVVCCAAAIGGDNLQDLKCGQLVGSTPWKQQVMQILGVVVAALVIGPVLDLLHDAYVIGGDKSPLQVPQANLMGTVAKGVFLGGLPWNIIGVGAGIAAVVIAIDAMLQKRKSKVRIPVMAFAVGVYLPFDLNVPIFLGGVVAWLVSRSLDRAQASPARRNEVERNGFLVAAGFITGESLMGIAIAVPVAVQESAYAIAPFGDKYEHLKFPGLILVGIVFYLLYRWALKATPMPPPKG
ncbi:MAG: oligopeptide transporter, OPT family [Deltaproteobacteria bacterium]|nr:oligopeptide transporter, OPT family [Deltaproteobacteria bacterium]MDQ3297812.1 oligopeptide transporter, OPT family [Myxococcota bacterium]